MTPAQSMMFMAAIFVAPHVDTRFGNGYALVCLVAAGIFWWAE